MSQTDGNTEAQEQKPEQVQEPVQSEEPKKRKGNGKLPIWVDPIINEAVGLIAKREGLKPRGALIRKWVEEYDGGSVLKSVGSVAAAQCETGGNGGGDGVRSS